MNVKIFNGAGQSDYLYGLVSGLSSTPLTKIEVLDIDLSSHLFNEFEKVKFKTVYRYQKKGTSYLKKGANILRFYFLQSKNILLSKKGIVHFQWLDRYYITDRILLPFLSRLRGHKTVFTVHNVNAGKRDKKDSYYNRLTLRIVYSLCNRLIVHTPVSKQELISEFKVNPDKISVIKHGMNNKVLTRGITQLEARRDLNIQLNQKVLLFFGNIDYYKGLDILIESLNHLPSKLSKDIVLLIAGNYKSVEYINHINQLIESSKFKSSIIAYIKYIPDEQIEKFFMASDCIVLPYRNIYQSGVLFMAYNFGLPAISTKIGNFENDIINGKTGILAESIDTVSIAQAIQKYFCSTIYQNLAQTRQNIRDWAYRVYSWEAIGRDTYNLYKQMTNGAK
ncbi:MAG TPA: glycosyltransferase [Lentimicrobium sp.]|nr:glycosyltransferase [Lentimicrobium sp.]